jgi:hypothetical protein
MTPTNRSILPFNRHHFDAIDVSLITLNQAANRTSASAKISAIVHVRQSRCPLETDVAQIRFDSSERIAPRPADAVIRKDEPRASSHSDEPEPTVVRRSEYGIASAESAESPAHIGDPDRRNIGTDHADWSRWQRTHRLMHADAEIAAALRDTANMPRPHGAGDLCIGIYGQMGRPKGLASKPHQKEAPCHAVEARCLDGANLSRKPSLDASGDRQFRHDHEMAPERCGLPLPRPPGSLSKQSLTVHRSVRGAVSQIGVTGTSA